MSGTVKLSKYIPGKSVKKKKKMADYAIDKKPIIDNAANTVNSFAMRTNRVINENSYNIRKPDGLYSCFKLTVGELSATSEKFVISNADVKKRELRMMACKHFVELYGTLIEDAKYKPKTGIDYLEYSSDTVLRDVKNVYVNNPTVFDKLKPTVVSFDSEGQPPTLVQIGFDEHTVALFHLPQYTELVKYLLQDPNIKKIICDVDAEERAFKIKCQNLVDIGELGMDGKKKSLITRIHELYGTELKKSKQLHIRGWAHPLPQAHIDYAIADAVWIWKIGNNTVDKIEIEKNSEDTVNDTSTV